jgi:GNAT superfamily N-acetyltransferase
MLTLIAATPEHLSVIQNIAYRAWPTTYKDLLLQEQIDYMLARMYDLPTLNAQLIEQGHQFILAKEGEEYLGFAGFEHHFESGSRTKLHKIYLLPSAQGKGLGKTLIEMAVSRSKAAGDDALFLHVLRENPAVQFYKKMGFQIIKRVDLPCGNDFFMNDFVMQFELG